MCFLTRNAHFNGDSIRFKGIRHGSKKIVYEVYINCVEGLEKEAGRTLEYFSNEVNGLKKKASTLAIMTGES
jgi:hypothetical protein